MPFKSALPYQKPDICPQTVLLASPDPVLTQTLRQIFDTIGLRVNTANDSETALALALTIEDSAVILLDVRLTGVTVDRLLVALHESGAHRRCAIALIADGVSEDWIARLREGTIDDIVPRSADAVAWATHLSTMQRGHRLLCELAHLREASVYEMQHDCITGAFNREAMLTILFRETDRVQRLHGSLCMVLFAIDDFAYWNDQLGREICDGLLREIAARVGRILRSYDLLGRTGPDQFLLALPGCSTINAVMMAERIRMDVFGELFTIPGSHPNLAQLKLTACFGVVASRGRSPVVVLREAEQTLALSRQSGSDSISCASDTPPQAEFSATPATLFTDKALIS